MPHVVASGIACPQCQGNDTSVRDSRPSGTMIRRRRLCMACGHRFSTFEGFAYDDAHPLLVFRALQLRAQMDQLGPEQQAAVLAIIELFGGKKSKPTEEFSVSTA